MGKTINRYPVLQPLLDEIAEIAGYIWQRGWGERNAGNFSVDVTDLLASAEVSTQKLMPGRIEGETVAERELPRKDLQVGTTEAKIDLPAHLSLRELAGRTLLVSTAGSRLRRIAKTPELHCGLLAMNPAGGRFAFTPLVEQDDTPLPSPTSELPTHLLIHHLFRSRDDTRRAVLHCHPTETISMTHLLAEQGETAVNERLQAMHAEMTLLIPEGVGLVSEIIPGSERLAKATITTLEHQKVALWRGHGSIATGSSLTEAFDRMDIVNKASTLFLQCTGAGKPEAGLTPVEIARINRHWHEN